MRKLLLSIIWSASKMYTAASIDQKPAYFMLIVERESLQRKLAHAKKSIFGGGYWTLQLCTFCSSEGCDCNLVYPSVYTPALFLALQSLSNRGKFRALFSSISAYYCKTHAGFITENLDYMADLEKYYNIRQVNQSKQQAFSCFMAKSNYTF